MISAIVLGDGPLGESVADALRARSATVAILARPAGGRHLPEHLTGAALVVDASRAEAVATNVDSALVAGCRAFVIATTGWQADAERVEAALRRAGAAAVAAPNLALGAALFLRLVDEAARLASALGGFEPSVVEWHRRSKADRPSGTAREIVRRLSAAVPMELDEVAVVRSGSMPGMHVVGLDGPGAGRRRADWGTGARERRRRGGDACVRRRPRRVGAAGAARLGDSRRRAERRDGRDREAALSAPAPGTTRLPKGGGAEPGRSRARP